MDQILSVIVIGLSYGMILFLLATGLSLTMGLMRVVNMAHGALYMFGGFVGLYVAQHSNFVWGVAAAAACAGVIGLLLELGFLRRLHKQETGQVLLTIGFIYVLMWAAQRLWGTLPSAGVMPSVLSRSIPIGSVEFPVYRLFLIGFGLVMALLLWLLQDKTKIGAKVRAGMDDREIATALGANLRVVFTGVFALGALVAGMCGLMGSTLTGVRLTLGWEALCLSLIVVVVGGTGSIQGALLGGVILGLLNAFGTVYFPSFADYMMYVALIIILLVRPSGLLGRKTVGAEAAEGLERAGVYGGGGWKKKPTPWFAVAARRARISRAKRLLPYLLGLALLVGVPFGIGGFEQSLMSKILIFAIFAMSLDLLMGYTGLISFGHAVYFGVAGYAVGILTVTCHISSFWLVFVLALLITAALAAIIGFISLRVSGVYFLLITLAFSQLFFLIAAKWSALTHGTDGFAHIKRPDLGWAVDWSNLKYYFFVLAFFVVCYVLMHRMSRSAFGRTLKGIRSNEPRMKSLGFNTWAAKYGIVIIAGVFAGVAGVLYAYYYKVMAPSDFGLETSALPMLMVIMGGGATLWGPCLGAAVILLLEHYLKIHLQSDWQLILGIIFVLSVMLLKGGMVRYLTRLWDWMWSLPVVLRARMAGGERPFDGGVEP